MLGRYRINECGRRGTPGALTLTPDVAVGQSVLSIAGLRTVFLPDKAIQLVITFGAYPLKF